MGTDKITFMRNIIIHSFLLLLFFCGSCSNEKCNAVDLKNDLITECLDIEPFQKYIDNETFRRSGIIIKKNASLDKSIQINKFNKPVLVITEEDIKKNNFLDFIWFEKLNINNDTADVLFRYGAQGVGVKVKFILKKCKWGVKDLSIWEE